MNEFIEKLIGRLEEKAHQTWLVLAERNGYERAIEIVKQEADKFGRDTNVGSKGNDVLEFANLLKELCCKKDEDYDNPVISPKYLNDTIENLLLDFNEQYNNGWIPVEEELPRDCDNRFYMCIVENHEEDLPMFCQYDEEYGFGFWHDIYDEHTLGFVDSEFKTNEEFGYEKVIAWKQLLPYQPKEECR